jgi:hypothetical protein
MHKVKNTENRCDIIRGFNHDYEWMCQQIVDGGHGLQIWTEAENILNKKLQKADKRWSSTVLNVIQDHGLPFLSFSFSSGFHSSQKS